MHKQFTPRSSNTAKTTLCISSRWVFGWSVWRLFLPVFGFQTPSRFENLARNISYRFLWNWSRLCSAHPQPWNAYLVGVKNITDVLWIILKLYIKFMNCPSPSRRLVPQKTHKYFCFYPYPKIPWGSFYKAVRTLNKTAL